jgi:hypothetical protein
MPHETRHFVSPSFTHKKLEPPFYKDVLDVFEDRMINWLLVPAKQLLKLEHGSVAAVALATNYIEGIEIYASGKDSKGQSKEFFRRGYSRIFATVSGPVEFQHAIAGALYDLLRCGFAHDAMFRSGIYFSTVRQEALTVTWPKKNGQFDPNGHLESAIINPERFVECIEVHFKEYMKTLRAKDAKEVKENFLAAVALKWRLGEPGHFVGMSEAEFVNGS